MDVFGVQSSLFLSLQRPDQQDASIPFQPYAEEVAPASPETGFSQDSFDLLFQLSSADFTLLQEVATELDQIFQEIDRLFETAGDNPLTREQEKQLAALEQKVDSILAPFEQEFDFFAGLSEEAAAELDGLFEQIDRLFETAGDEPLSPRQEEQLAALEEKIARVLDSVDGGFDPFEGLTEQASKDLEKLFDQIDRIFEAAGDRPLTTDQEKQLAALERKVDGILDSADDGFDPFEDLSEQAARVLEGLFDQIDKLFETAGDRPLTTEQEKQLAALDRKVDEILNDAENERSSRARSSETTT